MINSSIAKYSGLENSRIVDSAIEKAYSQLPRNDRGAVDALCAQMCKKRPVRTMGVKAYRELLFKLYVFLSKQKLSE